MELGYERDVRNIISALDEQQQKPSFEQQQEQQQQEQKDSEKTGEESSDEEESEEKETKAATASAPVHSRQTLLCSATLTTGIEQLSEISLRHPGILLHSILTFYCSQPSMHNILVYTIFYLENKHKCYPLNPGEYQ